MKNAKVTAASCAAFFTLIMTIGCAPAYHAYRSNCVPCRYCAPSPLPYEQYCGCRCHSCVAQRYLTNAPHVELDQPPTVYPQSAEQPGESALY